MTKINYIKCKVAGCENKGTLDKRDGKIRFTKGYCAMHYGKLLLHNDVNYVRLKHIKCKIEGCDKIGTVRQNGTITFKMGYCTTHYNRLKIHGDPLIVKLHFTKDIKVSTHPLYNTYSLMKARCLNKKSKSYKDYGGRGILICSRWLKVNGFDLFIKDMGDRPEGTSLDRIDNNGNYEPSNCRWTTQRIQCSNTRKNNKCVGVGFHKKTKKWRVRIDVDGKHLFLGQFDDHSNAVECRKHYELKYLGYNI